MGRLLLLPEPVGTGDARLSGQPDLPGLAWQDQHHGAEGGDGRAAATRDRPPGRHPSGGSRLGPGSVRLAEGVGEAAPRIGALRAAGAPRDALTLRSRALAARPLGI